MDSLPCFTILKKAHLSKTLRHFRGTSPKARWQRQILGTCGGCFLISNPSMASFRTGNHEEHTALETKTSMKKWSGGLSRQNFRIIFTPLVFLKKRRRSKRNKRTRKPVPVCSP